MHSRFPFAEEKMYTLCLSGAEINMLYDMARQRTAEIMAKHPSRVTNAERIVLMGLIKYSSIVEQIISANHVRGIPVDNVQYSVEMSAITLASLLVEAQRQYHLLNSKPAWEHTSTEERRLGSLWVFCRIAERIVDQDRAKMASSGPGL